MDYRSVQAQFEIAAQADNNLSSSAFTEITVFTDPGYQPVVDQLSDEYIAKLDPKLHPNAWLLLGVSEWRSQQFGKALTSANNGLAAGPLNASRDKVLLILLPALVIDSEIERDWFKANQSFKLDQYSKVKADYETAFSKVDSAMYEFGPGTPASTKYYLNYQLWRMLYNWQQIIIKLDEASPVRTAELKAAASIFESNTLQEEATKAKKSIPSSQPLRQIIDAR